MSVQLGRIFLTLDDIMKQIRRTFEQFADPRRGKNTRYTLSNPHPPGFASWSEPGARSGYALPLQPRHHLLHPLLSDVGVNLRGGDALVAQERLDVHQLRAGVEQVGGVSMAQLVGGNLLVDPRFLEHPAQVGARGLGRDWLLAHRAGEHELAPGLVFEPEPEHLAEGFRQRHQPFLVALADDAHRLGGPIRANPGGGNRGIRSVKIAPPRTVWNRGTR